MPRPVYTVDLRNFRENRHRTPVNPWWFVLQVAALGVLVYVLLALVMVG